MATTTDEFILSESQEQQNLFKTIAYMQNTYPELKWLYHVPNGGLRDIRVAKKLKAEGVKSGVPDLVLPIPRYPFHGLYIEMKKTKGGRVSKDQRVWLDFLKEQNYMVEVAKGCDEALEILKEYLKLPEWELSK